MVIENFFYSAFLAFFSPFWLKFNLSEAIRFDEYGHTDTETDTNIVKQIYTANRSRTYIIYTDAYTYLVHNSNQDMIQSNRDWSHTSLTGPKVVIN